MEASRGKRSTSSRPPVRGEIPKSEIAKGRKPIPVAAVPPGDPVLPAASLDSDSPVYKWYQLKMLLRRQIERGEYDPNTIFCNQQELMERHGVSYATVARALSDLVREGYLFRKRGVGTFVRPRVERRGGAGAIGLLVWDKEHILDHPAYSRLVAGISDPLRGAGYNLTFIFVNAEAEMARPGTLVETVHRAKIRALVAPTQPMLREEHLLPLAEQGLPIVPLNLDAPRLGPCAVHFDIGGATEMATAHLLERGYKRIVLMVPDNEEGPRRITGYRRALVAAGIDPAEELIITEPGKSPLHPEVQQALASLDPSLPAGMIASDDIAALTSLRVAQEAGWTVPDRLGIMGIGDFLPPELFEAPLSTVHVPFAVMGRMAADMALALLENRVPDPPVRHLAPRLVIRSTTARAGQVEPATNEELSEQTRQPTSA